jgi:hypothetical protein
MPQNRLLRSRSDKAGETSTRPSIFHQSKSQRLPAKTPRSIDQFLLSPSQQPAKTFRWSFGTRNSNQTSVYYDKDDGEKAESKEKKRGKKPAHVDLNKDINKTPSPKAKKDELNRDILTTTTRSHKKSRKTVEKTQSDSNLQPTAAKTDSTPQTQERYIPVGGSRSPARVDFAGRIIHSEGSSKSSRRREKKNKNSGSKSSKKQGRSSFSSQLRTELLLASEQLSSSNLMNDNDDNNDNDKPPSERLSVAIFQSDTERKNIHQVLDDLEHFEIKLSRDHTVLELGKRSLEFQMDQELSKSKTLELQFQELEKTMKRLEENLDGKMDELVNKEVLEAENEVLLLSKLRRQEVTLVHLQIQDYHQKNSTKRAAPLPAEIKVSSSAEQAQFHGKSGAQLQGEILQANAKLTAKRALIVQQAAERDHYREELKKLELSSDGSMIPKLKERIAILEKGKRVFMVEISRLKEEQKKAMSQHSHFSVFSIPETHSIDDSILSSDDDDDDDDDDIEFASGLKEEQKKTMSQHSHLSALSIPETHSIDDPISSTDDDDDDDDDNEFASEAVEAKEEPSDDHPNPTTTSGGGIASWSAWLFGSAPPPPIPQESSKEVDKEEPSSTALSEADKQSDRLIHIGSVI